jgi:hypothetical protein
MTQPSTTMDSLPRIDRTGTTTDPTTIGHHRHRHSAKDSQLSDDRLSNTLIPSALDDSSSQHSMQRHPDSTAAATAETTSQQKSAPVINSNTLSPANRRSTKPTGSTDWQSASASKRKAKDSPGEANNSINLRKTEDPRAVKKIFHKTCDSATGDAGQQE